MKCIYTPIINIGVRMSRADWALAPPQPFLYMGGYLVLKKVIRRYNRRKLITK